MSRWGHGRSRRTGLALGAGLVAVLALAFVANAVAGSIITSRLRANVARRLTGPVQVSLGGAPALLDALTNQIDRVDIAAPSTRLCAVSGADVRFHLTDVRRHGDSAHVGSLRGSVLIPPAAMTARLSAGQLSPTVTPDPARDSLDVAVGPGGVVQFALTPRLIDDRLTLSPTSVTLMGQPAPAQITALIDARAGSARRLPRLSGVAARSVRVDARGLAVSLASSGPVTIRRSRAPGTACG